MCIIIDANVASRVFDIPPQSDFKPVAQWLFNPHHKSKLVVGGKNLHEITRINSVRDAIAKLKRSGRYYEVEESRVNEEEAAVRPLCASDDPHVIALVRLSGVRILCSEDEALGIDFQNSDLVPAPQGHIYKRESHSHLLSSQCRACGKCTGK